MPSGVAWAQPCAALYADQVYSKELYIKAHCCLYRRRSTSGGAIHADLL